MRNALIIGVLLAATLATWMLLSSRPPRPEVPANAGAAPSGSPSDSTPLPDRAPDRPPRDDANRPAGQSPARSAPVTSAPVKSKGSARPGDASITGIVRNEARQPIAGARVRVIAHAAMRRTLPAPMATAHTDATGRFSVANVNATPPSTFVYVVADTPGRHRAVERAAPGSDVEFVLGSSGVVRGRVTVADTGRPCVGATVSVRGIRLAGEMSVTDAQGNYRIEGLAPASHHLSVVSADYPPLDRRTVVIAAGRETVADLTVERGLPLRGRVVDAVTGVGLPGARVQAYDFVHHLKHAVTDASGAFALNGLRRATPIILTCTGYATSETTVERLTKGHANPDATVDVRLTRAASIRGRVVTPDGAPAAGVEVLAYGRDRWPRDRTESDDDGAFHLATVPIVHEIRILARRKGFTRSLSAAMRLASGEARDGVVVRLGRGSAVGGRVTGPDGAPIADAVVELKPADWTYTEGRNARSGADGVFRMASVDDARYTLAVTSPAFLGRRLTDFVVADGVDRLDVDVTLDRGRTITGRVIDQHDAPITGARVHAQAARRGRDAPPAPAAVQTDDAGAFRLLGLADGEYRLIGTKEGHRRVGRFVVATAGSRDVEVRMIRTIDVSGRVRDATTGAAARTFEVRTRRQGSSRWRRQSFTDHDGQFRLRGLQPGLYEFAAASDGAVSTAPLPVDLTGPPPGTIVLDVRPGIVIAGRVLDPRGTPTAGASVTVLNDRGGDTGLRARTDEAGRFATPPVSRGPSAPTAYRLRVAHPDWIEVERAVRVDRDDENPVELTLLATGGVLALTVQDPNGRPIPGASHVVRRANGTGLPPDRQKLQRDLAQRNPNLADRERTDLLRRSLRSNAAGLMVRDFLPPGDYTIDVRCKGYKTTRRSFRAAVGVRTELLVTLAREH